MSLIVFHNGVDCNKEGGVEEGTNNNECEDTNILDVDAFICQAVVPSPYDKRELSTSDVTLANEETMIIRYDSSTRIPLSSSSTSTSTSINQELKTNYTKRKETFIRSELVNVYMNNLKHLLGLNVHLKLVHYITDIDPPIVSPNNHQKSKEKY